ncbi:MAG: adenylate cyclase [Parasphingorhabdus sp.]|jgi:adenylate cyclase
MKSMIKQLFYPKDLSAQEQRYHFVSMCVIFISVLSHLSLLLLFYIVEVRVLFLFNIGSVVLFTWLIWMVHGRWYVTSMVLLALEMIIHQIVGVIVMGWGSGFQHFLLTLVVGPFMFIRGNLKLKVACSFLALSCYVVLAYFYRNNYSTGLIPDSVTDTLYFATIITGLGAMAVLTMLFNQKLEKSEVALQEANIENERLLFNILPPSIAHNIQHSEGELVKRFEDTSILFADIIGFTKWAAKCSPTELVGVLNGLFSRFDDMLDNYGIEKIKTIGDAYMVAAGVPESRPHHAEDLTRFALAILEETKKFNKEQGTDLHIRIGMSSGPVVAGVIGKKKFAYDLWGDTVNTASRMESNGFEGKIQVSEQTYNLLKGDHQFEKIADVEIKGKGRLNTYVLTS